MFFNFLIRISRVIQDIALELKGTAIEAFWSGTSFLLCSTGEHSQNLTVSHC